MVFLLNGLMLEHRIVCYTNQFLSCKYPVSLLQISGFSLSNIRFVSCKKCQSSKKQVCQLQISGLSLAKKVCLLKTGMSVAKTVYLQQKETWLSMAKNYLSVAKTVLLYSYVSKKFDLFLYKYLDGKAQTQAFSPPNDIYCLNHILHLAV